MIVVEIKVNGVLIGHTYIKNVNVLDEEKDCYLYKYTFINIPDEKIVKGSVVHCRKDGFLKLVEVVHDDIEMKLV